MQIIWIFYISVKAKEEESGRQNYNYEQRILHLEDKVFKQLLVSVLGWGSFILKNVTGRM